MWIIWGSQFYLLSILIGGSYLFLKNGVSASQALGVLPHFAGTVLPLLGIVVTGAVLLLSQKKTLDESFVRKTTAYSVDSKDFSESIANAGQKWATWNVILWALTELIAVLGIVSTLQAGDLMQGAPYFGMAIFLFLKERPRFESWLVAQGFSKNVIDAIALNSPSELSS